MKLHFDGRGINNEEGERVAVVKLDFYKRRAEFDGLSRLLAAAPAMREALRFVREFYQENFDIMPAFKTVDDVCAAALGEASP